MTYVDVVRCPGKGGWVRKRFTPWSSSLSLSHRNESRVSSAPRLDAELGV